MSYQHLPQVVGVVGAGQMGSGIAQVMASKGLQVILSDRSTDLVTKGIHAIEKSLGKILKTGTISEAEVSSTLERIKPASGLEAMHQVDFVVEAVSENEEVKRSLFRQLDDVAPLHAILASNTSSISITRLGSATRRAHRVVGMHFMNPVPLIPLVELIKGMHTSQQTFEIARGLSEHLGKQVCVSQDRPGFIVNRVLMPMINEAFFALMEGVGTAEDIDKGCKLGTNVPMGPLRLADFIGLDTCLSIMKVLHQGMGDAKYRPCPLLAQYVDAGWHGQKAGKGVYQYEHHGGEGEHHSGKHVK